MAFDLQFWQFSLQTSNYKALFQRQSCHSYEHTHIKHMYIKRCSRLISHVFWQVCQTVTELLRSVCEHTACIFGQTNTIQLFLTHYCMCYGRHLDSVKWNMLCLTNTHIHTHTYTHLPHPESTSIVHSSEMLLYSLHIPLKDKGTVYVYVCLCVCVCVCVCVLSPLRANYFHLAMC